MKAGMRAALATFALALFSEGAAMAADHAVKLTVPMGQKVTVAALPDGSAPPGLTPAQVPVTDPKAGGQAGGNPGAGSAAPPGMNPVDAPQQPKTYELTIMVKADTLVCLPTCQFVPAGIPFTLSITAETLSAGLKLVEMHNARNEQMEMLISVNNGPFEIIAFDRYKADRYRKDHDQYPPFSTYLPPAVLAQFKAPSC